MLLLVGQYSADQTRQRRGRIVTGVRRVLKLHLRVAGLSPRLVVCEPVDSDQALVTEVIVR